MWESGAGGEASFDCAPFSLGVSLGTCEDGEEVFQLSADRFCHTAIVGRTGSGKSNHIRLMQREDLRSGAGVAIIATHPEDALYPLACIPESRMEDAVVIDATDAEYLPCLNPLGIDVADRKAVDFAVERTIELLESNCEHDWAGPRFEDYARLALGTIMDPGFELCGEPRCIASMQRVLTDPELVKKWLRYCTDCSLYDHWTRIFPQVQRSNDAGELLEWVLAKARPFMTNGTLAAMFGPGRKTVDFGRIVDEGGILVVLAPGSHIGEEAARIIRTWILMELNDAIMARGGGGGRIGAIRSAGRGGDAPDPFYVYVDEFGEVASDGFARMLAQVRKRSVGMVLSFQSLGQLNAFSPRDGRRTSTVLDSVLANAGTVIAYQTGVGDARILAERFNVEGRRMREIRRYRPKAMVRIDADERGPMELEVPLAPEPDDPAMPGRIFDRMVERGVLLPVGEMACERVSQPVQEPGPEPAEKPDRKPAPKLRDYLEDFD